MQEENELEGHEYPKEKTANVGFSPIETSEDLIKKKINPLMVNESGIKKSEITIDLFSKDIQAFWYSHIRFLSVIILFCLIYFVSILVM